MPDGPNPPSTELNTTEGRTVRRADPMVGAGELWQALSNTAGIGFSITDTDGRLLFVNATSQQLFSGSQNIDYTGKHISDFHSPEFVAERMELIRRVVAENKPISIHHIYHGVGIDSTIWPINDSQPPFNRVIVVSRQHSKVSSIDFGQSCEVVSSQYIELGPYDVLSRRELEVLALLGHGLSVPQVAKVLHRSPKTIEHHKQTISEKLHMHGQAELVTVVTAMGLEVADAHLKRLSGTA